MSNDNQDYKNTTSDYSVEQGTASLETDSHDVDYSEAVSDRKIPDMKEYPVKKTSFSKIRYVQK